MESTGAPTDNEHGVGITGSSSSRRASGNSPPNGATAAIAEEAEKAFRQREWLEQQMEALASFLTAEGMCMLCPSIACYGALFRGMHVAESRAAKQAGPRSF